MKLRGLFISVQHAINMQPITFESFLSEMKANQQVNNVQITQALLGNYQQVVFPGEQQFQIKNSSIDSLRLGGPPQARLEVVACKINHLHADDGGTVRELEISSNSKVNSITGMPSIGGLIERLTVKGSEVNSITLYGDHQNHAYLDSIRFTDSKATKISLTTLTIENDVIIKGDVNEVELINVEVKGRVTLNGVKQCTIVNGKYKEISMFGPMISLNIMSDQSKTFWRQVPETPDPGPLSLPFLEQFTIAFGPAQFPIIDTTYGKWRIENLKEGSELRIKNCEVRWGQ